MSGSAVQRIFTQDLPTTKGALSADDLFENLCALLSKLESTCRTTFIDRFRKTRKTVEGSVDDVLAIQKENAELNTATERKAGDLVKRLAQRKLDNPAELAAARAAKREIAEKATGNPEAELKRTNWFVIVGIILVSLIGGAIAFQLEMKLGTQALAVGTTEKVSKAAAASIAILLLVFTPIAAWTAREKLHYRGARKLSRNATPPRPLVNFLFWFTHAVIVATLVVIVGLRAGVVLSQGRSLALLMPAALLVILAFMFYGVELALHSLDGDSAKEVKKFEAAKATLETLEAEEKALAELRQHPEVRAMLDGYEATMNGLSGRLTQGQITVRRELKTATAISEKAGQVTPWFDKAARRLATQVGLDGAAAMSRYETWRPEALSIGQIDEPGLEDVTLNRLDFAFLDSLWSTEVAAAQGRKKAEATKMDADKAKTYLNNRLEEN